MCKTSSHVFEIALLSIYWSSIKHQYRVKPRLNGLGLSITYISSIIWICRVVLRNLKISPSSNNLLKQNWYIYNNSLKALRITISYPLLCSIDKGSPLQNSLTAGYTRKPCSFFFIKIDPLNNRSFKALHTRRKR